MLPIEAVVNEECGGNRWRVWQIESFAFPKGLSWWRARRKKVLMEIDSAGGRLELPPEGDQDGPCITS